MTAKELNCGPYGNSDPGGNQCLLGPEPSGNSISSSCLVRKFSLGSTGDEISSLIIIQSLFVQ